jgi:hypothetical protein
MQDLHGSALTPTSIVGNPESGIFFRVRLAPCSLNKNVRFWIAFGFVILKICVFENDENARFRNAADRSFFKIVGFELKSAISFHSFFKYETPKISSQNCIMTKIP